MIINKEQSPRSVVRAAVGIFVVAIVVRLVYAAQAKGCPLFLEPTIDATVYYSLARDFAQGHWLYPLGEPYWQPPFYSFVLALWMKIVGDSVMAAKCAQFVLGSVNCVLIYALGKRLFSHKVGLIAGLAAALYAPFIYFDGELLTPTLQIFLNLAGILLLFLAMEKKSLGRLAIAGLMLGLSIITRPDVLPFVIGAAAWILLVYGREASAKPFPAKGAVIAASVFLLCAILPTIPLAVRNRIVGKDSVIISSNGGINFYIGNNPRYDELLAIRPGADWDALVNMPLRNDWHAKPSKQSAYFFHKGFNWMRTHPMDWLLLTIRKSVDYITAIEGRRNHDLYFMRNYSSLYNALMFRIEGLAFPFGIVLPIGCFAFPFVIVLPLSILGLLRAPRGRDKSLMIAYIAAQFAATVAFFVVARYRVTVVPILLVYAAFGATELFRMIRERRPNMTHLIVAGLFLIVSSANIFGVDRDRRLIDAESHYFVAGLLDNSNNYEQAMQEYELAISLNPRYYMSHFFYGQMLAKVGRYLEAREHLEAAVQLTANVPMRSADVYWQLGLVCEALGERQSAKQNFVHAAAETKSIVKEFPDNPIARQHLAYALAKTGKFSEAIRELREACRLDPKNAEAWFVLGVACHQANQKTDAQSAFDKAIGIDSAYSDRVWQFLDTN